ncbi:MAG TPA: pyridoxal phosphate-dependent aminotransferase [Candidatus Acidoferrales bacterium]|nr:pyridoxal phosphate-dependent aminotransferase [Candidatus Acidoferrales bacterium]
MVAQVPQQSRAPFASRQAHLRPEGAYEVMARSQELEAKGHDMVHLEAGEPDFNGPPNASLVGIAAIASGQTRYVPPAGLTKLREIIADTAGKTRGMKFSPKQVLISPGAKPAMFFPTLTLVEPGDEVIYPDPGFPTYEAMLLVAGGVPKPVPLLESKSFSFDLDAFDRLISDKTRMIILNSPSNPTGGVIPLKDLQHIADAARRHDCWIVSDEIYNQIVFDGQTVTSIASLPGMAERTVIVDGFSKTYAMHGWRLGYGIMPEALAERVRLFYTHGFGCTAHASQIAAIEALTGPQDHVRMMVEQYQRRREIIIDGLNKLPGVHCLKPQGAFYAFPNIQKTGKTSQEIANLFLDFGVALLPGNAFGKYGEGYLRLSYANSIPNIQKALERMAKALNSIH